jgi:hypothetical protein
VGRSVVAGRRANNTWDPADRPFIIGGVALIIVITVTFSLLLGIAALDVWSGIIVFLVIVSAGVPALRWVARAEGDPWLFKVMYGGLIVKMFSSLVRYYFIMVVYDGNGDAGVYHEAGIEFARRFSAGEPIHPLPIISAFPVESHWIADVTGSLYIVTSPSAYAGFFFFSTLCFAGQVFLVRAFKVAVPEGDYRRYAVLVLFLPSLLFWPSSIGKESLLIGCIGLLVYGGALLLAPRPRVRGVVFFALGTVALTFVRPHIAYMSIAALGLAVAVGVLAGGGLGGSGIKGASTKGRLVRLVALVVLLGLASFAGTRVAARFGDDEGTGARTTLEETRNQTSTGGSEFKPLTISTPVQLPLGIPSVAFRPFPWEARSVNSLIAAIEGLLLVGLFVASWRRLLSLPALLLRRPYLVFALSYVVVFSVGFSYLANFGILARQRTQMLPMVLVLLALPVKQGLDRRQRGQDHPAPALVEINDSKGSVGP